MRGLIACLALFALLVAVPGARADSNDEPVNAFGRREVADFSKQIERELAQRGAYVALVFRAGRERDALPEGLRYSHGAIWVYTPIETANGETHYGYAVYNLYHGEFEPRRSFLVQDWPFDFVQGDAVGQVGVIVPSPEMQLRLLDVIASADYQYLHQPYYSLLSNPFDARFQNAPEFLLDVVSAAGWQTVDRVQIKVNLVEYFRPERVRVGWLSRLVWGLFDRRVTFEDQGRRVFVASYDSIANFMLRYEMASEVFEIEAPHYIPYRPY